MSTKFYIIWNPNSDKAPTRKFTAKSSASITARQMALRFPTEPFYVLEAHEVYETPAPGVQKTELT